jgi:hypothetical protein
MIMSFWIKLNFSICDDIEDGEEDYNFSLSFQALAKFLL